MNVVGLRQYYLNTKQSIVFYTCTFLRVSREKARDNRLLSSTSTAGCDSAKSATVTRSRRAGQSVAGAHTKLAGKSPKQAIRPDSHAESAVDVMNTHAYNGFI